MGLLDRLVFSHGGGEGDARAKPSRADLRSPIEEELLAPLRANEGDDASLPLRFHMRFVGTVQGVGFRWTNRDVAKRAGTTGWVRNESDGSVIMELQGTGEAIAKHLDLVHELYHPFNNRIWMDEAAPLPEMEGERGFEVRF
ncbi:MAG: acylphosphatase [Collinsella sp.]|nr:acylphosphatase [Collinsella sp.]